MPKKSSDITVPLPGSKSITNRALLLAALAEGETVLENALDSEDTQMMFHALKQLGLILEHDVEQSQMCIIGTGGRFPNRKAELYVGNSGTTARFLTAALAFSNGEYRLYGKPRMHERPIRDLVNALRSWGAEIEFENQNDCPPLLIHGVGGNNKRHSGVFVTQISGAVSSQFLSAMLMTAPLVTQEGHVEIRLTDTLVSEPYIEMTVEVMRSFGVCIMRSDDDNGTYFWLPDEQQYRPQKPYFIEPDASAASYFFAAAAVRGDSVTVPGLSRHSLQGDVGFVDCLQKMGCTVQCNDDSITVSRNEKQPLVGVTVDMNAISDTAQTLGVVALFAKGATEIRNIAHVRFKETDRISALATELRKFGAEVEEFDDGLSVTPPQSLNRTETITVSTYDDHRMAMSFAVATLEMPNVVIENPECVQKTFPNFFEVWNKYF